MEIVKSDEDLDDFVDGDDDEDSSFIASEHVSLTQELEQKQHLAVRELQDILKLLGKESEDDDLLKTVSSLRKIIEGELASKAHETDDIHINGIEDEDDFDLLSLEGLTDEKEILEVAFFSKFNYSYLLWLGQVEEYWKSIWCFQEEIRNFENKASSKWEENSKIGKSAQHISVEGEVAWGASWASWERFEEPKQWNKWQLEWCHWGEECSYQRKEWSLDWAVCCQRRTNTDQSTTIRGHFNIKKNYWMKFSGHQSEGKAWTTTWELADWYAEHSWRADWNEVVTNNWSYKTVIYFYK